MGEGRESITQAVNALAKRDPTITSHGRPTDSRGRILRLKAWR